MTNPITKAQTAVDAARANLDRSRANHEAAQACHAECNQRRELLAGATLTNGDDDTFARLAQATDDAETARRAVDTGALIIKAATKALADAEKALDLTRRRQVADRIRAQAVELEALCAEIEAISQQLGAKIARAVNLEPTIAQIAKHGLGINGTGYNRALRDKFIGQLREAVSPVSRNEAPHFFHGLVDAAKREIARIENDPMDPRLEA